MRALLIACATTLTAAAASFAVPAPAAAAAAAAAEDGCGVGYARNAGGYCQKTGRGSNCPPDHFRTLAGSCQLARRSDPIVVPRADDRIYDRYCGRGYMRDSRGLCRRVRYSGARAPAPGRYCGRGYARNAEGYCQKTARGSNCPPDHFRTLAGYCERVRY